MPKKSAVLKSKPRPKSKSAAVKTKRRGNLTVWSIQSVGDLLDAVNRETLGRIEGYEKRIEERLKVWEQFQLNNIQGGVDAIHSTNTNIVVPDIQAIKRRVGA